MYGKRKSKFVTALTVLLFLLLGATVVGAIVKFTNIGDKIKDLQDTTFRIEYGGVSYMGDENELTLPDSGQARFIVKNGGNYTVKVVPNVTSKTDFEYTVDGVSYPYSGEDLTSIIVKKSNIFNDNFVVDCSESFLLQDVLSRLWGGKEVTLNGIVSYPYLMTITSDNGEIISISIGQPKFVTDLTLSDSSIVFGVVQNEKGE